MGNGVEGFFKSKNTEQTSCLDSSALNQSCVTVDVSKAVTVDLPTCNPHCLLDKGLVILRNMVMYRWTWRSSSLLTMGIVKKLICSLMPPCDWSFLNWNNGRGFPNVWKATKLERDVE